MKTQKENSWINHLTTTDNSQLDVKFEDGKLVHVGLMHNNGELHLNANKMSLADEIKILIRKLWN